MRGQLANPGSCRCQRRRSVLCHVVFIANVPRSFWLAAIVVLGGSHGSTVAAVAGVDALEARQLRADIVLGVDRHCAARPQLAGVVCGTVVEALDGPTGWRVH